MSEHSTGKQPQEREDSQLDALKTLLLNEEHQDIGDLRQRLDDPQKRAGETAKVLSKSLRISSDEDKELPSALEKPMLESMQHSIKKNPDEIAGLLFPVMGPAIRQAITDTLRKMIDTINHTLEHSFSAQGLKWRIEAMRSGIPFTEVVMRHSLDYRVEQVLLIQPESGLLIQDLADQHMQTHDPDAVSAMLTAISNFVRETFLAGDSGKDLNEVTMGDHTVLIIHGPKAYLACAVRGILSRELHEICRETLEDIHRHYGEELAQFDGNREKMQPVQSILERCLVSKEKESPDKSGPSPVLLIVLALIAIGGWFGYDYWRLQAKQDHLISLLEQSPGIIVTKAASMDGKLLINGMRDPLAATPTKYIAEAGLETDQIEMQFTPYHDMDPQFALTRAKTRLQPPASINLAIDEDGSLTATGSASKAWQSNARMLAMTVPGIKAFNDGKLIDNALKTKQDRLLSLLEQTPGIIVTKAEPNNGKLLITGMRDPLSPPPSQLINEAGLKPDNVALQFTAYHDMAPQFALPRAKRRLQPPASVTLSLSDDGILHAVGSASKEWQSNASMLAMTAPGINAFNTDKLVDTDKGKKQDRLLALLEQAPGIIVTKTVQHNDKLIISGMRDPLAAEPTTILAESGLESDNVTMQFTPYQDMGRDFALQRANTRLQPPVTVTLELTDAGILQPSGAASESWIKRARTLAVTIPGVNGFDDAKMQDPDELLLAEIKTRLQPPGEVKLKVVHGNLTIKGTAGHSWISTIREKLADLEDLKSIYSSSLFSLEQLELNQLRKGLESLHILFVENENLSDEQKPALDEAAADIAKILTLSEKLSLTASFILVGRTDGTGTQTFNATLAQKRASKVNNYLVDQGVSPTLLSQLAAPPPMERGLVDPTLKRVEFKVNLQPIAISARNGN